MRDRVSAQRRAACSCRPAPVPCVLAFRNRVRPPWYPATGPPRQEKQDRPRVLAGGHIMPTKITSDALESYLHCKVKGPLKLAGQQGTRCDFETILMEL